VAAVVFDTNIWIAYHPRILPRSLHMSVVVIQELLTGAVDATDVKKQVAAKKQYEREGKLLVPTADDWIKAGKVRLTVTAASGGKRDKDKLKLTCLKVIPFTAMQTNKYPRPIWHLISESNSVPTRDFVYGAPIRGMHPAITDATPDPLEPGAAYRLVVEAGNFKGQHDFVPIARTP